MTVLPRGARVRRGGRRPGWVLLTALLVLAMGASSALVFTNRVELLKLAVILALWAAVAGAFVSVLYRRQSDADQSRVRDLKLVYDLQLDREISARREYELTVESQLRRELASELRAQAADEVAALRAELAALRTSLEILFDTDLDHRRALENSRSDWARNGESAPVDWVSSDRVATVPPENALERTDESAIIDVSEVGVPPAGGGPPRQPAPPREQVRPPYPAPPPSPPPPEPPPEMQPQAPQWHPAAADGEWLPAGARQQLVRRRRGECTARSIDGPPPGPAFQPGRIPGRPAWRVQRVGSPVAVAAFDGVPRRRCCGRTGHRGERGYAAASGAAAAATTDTPASQRRCGGGRARAVGGATVAIRRPVGRRPAGAIAGRTHRRRPAAPA